MGTTAAERALLERLVSDGTLEAGDKLLSKEGAAALIETKPSTITHYASQSRCKSDEERDRYDMPLPVGYVLVERKDYPGMGPRRTREPRWSRREVLRWRAAGRRPPKVARERYPAGSPAAGAFAPRPMSRAS